jgi:DeoR family transcriptional regulator, aga operon transcriptional repressor
MMANDLSAVERRDKTLQMLQEKGRVVVSELTEVFGTSAVTIRKDLAFLEERGALARTHGGAVLPSHIVPDQPIEQKAQQHGAEKQRIGQAGAGILEDGDSVIFDSGSTTIQVARHLNGRKSLMALTNSLRIALEITVRAPNVDLLMLGGLVRCSSGSVIGSHAEQDA